MKPMHKMIKDVQVGIYDSEYVARIYKDKIILTIPYVKWEGNTGGYAESKESIRDPKIVNRVLSELNDDCEDSAWEIIGNYLQDPYLAAPYF